jgi:hypothetical protein
LEEWRHVENNTLVFSLEDGVKVVSRHQKGETVIAIASSMSVGKPQV